MNVSQYWGYWSDDMGAHQTTVPLVLSALLAQTFQLQLVDLQVRPDKTNKLVFLYFQTKKATVSCPFCDFPPGSRPREALPTAPETRLLTVSLDARRRTLHPAARAAGFSWVAVLWSL